MNLPRDALGLGLRPAFYRELASQERAPDYFEIISENFLLAGTQGRSKLEQIRERSPVVLHGVALNLLGHAPLDEKYLDDVCRLADDVDAAFVTDHLCWTGDHGTAHHDLLPFPYVPQLVELAATRAAYVQRRLGRPFGLENVSTYVSFAQSTLAEADFYASVVRESGCWFMLDLNNVYVSSVNRDPARAVEAAHVYLDAIDFSRVLQVHLAGHTREAKVLIDTHDKPVCDEVWELYKAAWRRGGPFPTLLEWDAEIPALAVVLDELEKAKQVRT